jgi:BirA family transcriptional regulator, biotin operon repressor / biotin---[acetyl-CoA-carboxylase] ligase
LDQSESFVLGDSAAARDYRLLVYDEIGSTNDEAMRLARAGDPGRVWLIARQQSKGRGRRGRQWSSPTGNLYASLLLIDEVAPIWAPQLGFVAGVALAHALRKCVAGNTRLRLKWPNDILFDNAKLAGILLESTGLPDGRFACVLGIGVNCAAAPGDLPYRAMALAEIADSLRSPQEVFLQLSSQIVRTLAQFSGGTGFETIRAEWLSLAAGVGAPIRVDMPTESISGVFRTIDATGRLVVESEDAVKIIEAGDIWLAPQTGTVA